MWNQYKFDEVLVSLYSVRNHENEWGHALKSCADYLHDVDIYLVEEDKITQKRQVFSSVYMGYRNDDWLLKKFRLLFGDLIDVVDDSNNDFLIFKTPIHPNLANSTDIFKQPYSISIHSVFCFPIFLNNVNFIFFIVLKDQDIEFSDKKINNCQRISFHVKKVIQQLIEQNDLLSQRFLFYEIYNMLNISVIVSNHFGCIDFVNSAAHKLLTEKFNETSQAFTLENISYQHLKGIFSLKPVNGDSDFYISDDLKILVTEKNIVNHLSSYKLTLLLDTQLKDNNQSINLIHNLYQLTKSELSLTMALMKGSTIMEYSKDNNVSLNTSRTHLKSIFKKTKTNKQSELLSLLCRLVTISSSFSD